MGDEFAPLHHPQLGQIVLVRWGDLRCLIAQLLELRSAVLFQNFEELVFQCESLLF
jgi:hypothetical protein